MSSDSLPISLSRFAVALESLSVESLYAKAAEIRNSISKLQSSNEQLEPFAVDGDVDCYEAIIENRETIKRMEERVALLKAEVEKRGSAWHEEENADGLDNTADRNGTANQQLATNVQTNGPTNGPAGDQDQNAAPTYGTTGAAQTDTVMGDADQEGVHL